MTLSMLSQTSRLKAWWYALVVFAVDQITKLLTVLYLPAMSASSARYPYGGVALFRDFFGIEFSLVHQTNLGAAWGLFAGHQTLLLIARMLLIAAVIAYALFFNRQRGWDIPIVLIVGGALSNVADVLIYGHVIDMFNFVFWGYHYPVFNVADSAICVGIAWLFLLSIRADRAKKQSGG